MNVKKLITIGVAVAVAGIVAYLIWDFTKPDDQYEGFVSGNGRTEATEINVSTKQAGRVKEILVEEGDFVTAGQKLAIMQSDSLEAQLSEAQAQLKKAISAQASAQAQVSLKEKDKMAAQSVVAQHMSELKVAKQRLARSSALSKSGAVSVQEFDDDSAQANSAQSIVNSSKAKVAVSDAAVSSSKAERDGAAAMIKAAEAQIKRIQADLDDCILVAPRDGRVQYRIAQAGEVLGAGGKVLNLVDVSDVYMTFFLPETIVGQVPLGGEVRIVLDAMPDNPIPAKISFVASVAQFTPKTVETQSERQKLMFRVKARINRDLLLKNKEQVKTGLPGVAWIRLDSNRQWPATLAFKGKE